MYVYRSFTCGLLTYFASNFFSEVLYYSEVLPARLWFQQIYRGHISTQVTVDFDTSVNCFLFCSCGLLGPFLFARHVVSSYNARSRMTRFSIKR